MNDFRYHDGALPPSFYPRGAAAVVENAATSAAAIAAARTAGGYGAAGDYVGSVDPVPVAAVGTGGAKVQAVSYYSLARRRNEDARKSVANGVDHSRADSALVTAHALAAGASTAAAPLTAFAASNGCPGTHVADARHAADAAINGCVRTNAADARHAVDTAVNGCASTNGADARHAADAAVNGCAGISGVDARHAVDTGACAGAGTGTGSSAAVAVGGAGSAYGAATSNAGAGSGAGAGAGAGSAAGVAIAGVASGANDAGYYGRPSTRRGAHADVASGGTSKDSAKVEGLPPMSADGGTQEEFEAYWQAWRSRRRWLERGAGGSWIERRAHPQVNAERYWFNEATQEIVWQPPADADSDAGRTLSGADGSSDVLTDLSGHGPVWDLPVAELKLALKQGRAAELGLEIGELAKRAISEYERFLPKVLSWHDYQYYTFWFFGGLDKEEQAQQPRSGGGASSFFAASGATSQMFADESFFRAVADLLPKRFAKMHPINLTYFIWTFSRAGVVIPTFMRSLGDFLCDHGIVPMFDRCSLGTMVWNFSKQDVHHDRLFEICAREFRRPNRVRSLAPRNYQNGLIAYSRLKYAFHDLFNDLARGMPRLLENHDPRHPKLKRNLLFSYTCVYGSEVLADCFRISSLVVIAKTFHEIRARGPDIVRCFASFLDYTKRSVETSPAWMREPGDACGVVRQLAFYVVDVLGSPANAGEFGSDADAAELRSLLAGLDLPSLKKGAPERAVQQMEQALRRAGL
eukprot:TRINITY_DN4453_c0_g1_i2.p1 TRINITY_DN4453_c0_g1~~TRINITY_DN4453_c0_g1_i2.p1  ORF type:complete len:752 (-),score=159.13 TRINITY_DN4453_c0_g1_i2:48-2303(-)